MSTTLTPIALFTYNRPEHARLALTALTRSERFDECRLHIYCDGLKSPEQAAAVEASRQVARRWASRLGAEVTERAENLGLARSIVAGVTELCERYGRVIVVEDDLVVSLDFVNYMLQALDRYQDAPNVYQVSGYMFPARHPAQPDAFFLPMTTTLGWATWTRAWRIFDWNATRAVEQLADPQTKYRFDLDGCYPYSNMLANRLAGKNQSWGILWWWAVFRAQGLVLHPRQSLLWLGGYDGTGTHSGSAPNFSQPSPEAFAGRRLSSPIAFPLNIAADVEAFNRVKAFFRVWRQSKPPKTLPLVNFLRQIGERLLK
jgi:hypothetical protein